MSRTLRLCHYFLNKIIRHSRLDFIRHLRQTVNIYINVLYIKISTRFFYIILCVAFNKKVQIVFNTNYIPIRFNSRESAKKLVVMTNEW